jgi:ATP-dependent DNA helicase RecG
MTLEDQHADRKSLRTVTGKTADWDALAKDWCVSPTARAVAC